MFTTLKLTHLWLRIHTVFGQGYDEDPVTWQTRGDVFQDSGEADAEPQSRKTPEDYTPED